MIKENLINNLETKSSRHTLQTGSMGESHHPYESLEKSEYDNLLQVRTDMDHKNTSSSKKVERLQIPEI